MKVGASAASVKQDTPSQLPTFSISFNDIKYNQIKTNIVVDHVHGKIDIVKNIKRKINYKTIHT